MRIIIFFIYLINITACFASTVAIKPYDTLKKDLPNKLGTFQHIRFESSTASSIDFYAAKLNSNYTARLFYQPETIQSQAKSIDELQTQQQFLVAINGGFYTPAFKPAGLFIYQGKTLSRLSRDPLLTTCIEVTKQNTILLKKNPKECLSANNAIQTGPLLVDYRNEHLSIDLLQAKLPRLKSFFSPNYRTILAQADDDSLLMITTSPLSLHDAATILKFYPQAFGIKFFKIALNLDGGSSTGMYVNFKDVPFYFHELKYVKTLIFVK